MKLATPKKDHYGISLPRGTFNVAWEYVTGARTRDRKQGAGRKGPGNLGQREGSIICKQQDGVSIYNEIHAIHTTRQ